VQEYDEAEKIDRSDDAALRSLIHRTIKKVTHDYRRLSFNTAIAALMEYVNELYKLKTDGFSAQWQESVEALVRLISPIAPHMGAELWQQLGRDDTLDFVAWPTWDESLLVLDTMKIAVQVNGKLRAEIAVAKDATQEVITAQALAEENVQKYLDGKEPTKVIYVPGRLVSIVVKGN
jgi:leucyl-tRNA synthetase